MKRGDLIEFTQGGSYRAIVCADLPDNPCRRVPIYVFHNKMALGTGLWEITVRKLTTCFRVINGV